MLNVFDNLGGILALTERIAVGYGIIPRHVLYGQTTALAFAGIAAHH